MAVQAPRRRGGTFVAMEPEKNKRASAAASVRLCHLFIHHAAPRHAGAKGLSRAEKRWRNKVNKERAKAGLGNI